MGKKMKMIEVNGLRFSYGRGPVLDDVSFSVEKGALCGLFGPNGSGKTTLFKCCLKFLKTQAGSVVMNGKDVGSLSVSEMAKIVSYVPQDHSPPFPFLVKEMVIMGRSPHLRGVFGVSREDKQKAYEAMERAGILELADRQYNQLSGGQRQMVLMARAIAQESPIMFLDEPTAALDFSNQMRIWRIMRDIVDSGVTILACSHDPNHVSWFCDDVIVMGQRSVIASGNPSDVINDRTLNLLYDESCVLSDFKGVPMVMPSTLFNGNIR